MSMADRIVVMNAGRIEQAGSGTDIYLRPRTRFVAEFIGDANLIACTTSGTTVTLQTGQQLTVEPPPQGKALAMLRPEHVVCTSGFGADVGAGDGTLVFTGPTFAGGVLGLGTINVALRPADDALRAAFDAAITDLNRDGTNKALTEKWFGVDISVHE